MPNAAEAYSILTQEQTHQEFSKAMVVSECENQEPSIACRVEKRKLADFKKRNDTKSKRQNFYCEHCKIHGHTMDKCWKIHGYPSNVKSNTWRKDEGTGSKANAAITEENTHVQEKNVDTKLTPEQYNQLMALLSKNSSGNTTPNSAHFAGKHCLYANKKSTWIIDSGASDHICYAISLFSNYKPLKGKSHHITIPNGKHIKVDYIGNFVLGKRLVLTNVLYAPDFHFNLISVHKLVKDMHCKVVFGLDNCSVQEYLKKSLYQVDVEVSDLSSKSQNIKEALAAVNSQENILQDLKKWHLRLGHIPFD